MGGRSAPRVCRKRRQQRALAGERLLSGLCARIAAALRGITSIAHAAPCPRPRRDVWDYALDYNGHARRAPTIGDWDDADGAWEEPPHGMESKRRARGRRC